MFRNLAGAAAAVLAVAAAGGCTSSGGTTASSPPARPTTTTGSTPASPTTAPPGSTGAPSSKSMTAITPVRPLTCATLPRPLGHFRTGGHLPSGVPLPQAVPTLTCKGANGSVAIVWTSVSAAQYKQELLQTGWSAPGVAAIFTKSHAPQQIHLASVHGALIAVYQPT